MESQECVLDLCYHRAQSMYFNICLPDYTYITVSDEFYFSCYGLNNASPKDARILSPESVMLPYKHQGAL